MLTKTVTYEDFNGNEVTETYNFFLNVKEVFDMMGIEVNDEGEALSRMADIDPKQITVVMGTISDIMLKAYGIRSEDGKQFKKSPELREAFEESAAFAALFEDVALDDKSAAQFLEGVLPKKVLEQMKSIKLEDPKQGA